MRNDDTPEHPASPPKTPPQTPAPAHAAAAPIPPQGNLVLVSDCSPELGVSGWPEGGMYLSCSLSCFLADPENPQLPLPSTCEVDLPKGLRLWLNEVMELRLYFVSRTEGSMDGKTKPVETLLGSGAVRVSPVSSGDPKRQFGPVIERAHSYYGVGLCSLIAECAGKLADARACFGAKHQGDAPDTRPSGPQWSHAGCVQQLAALPAPLGRVLGLEATVRVDVKQHIGQVVKDMPDIANVRVFAVPVFRGPNDQFDYPNRAKLSHAGEAIDPLEVMEPVNGDYKSNEDYWVVGFKGSGHKLRARSRALRSSAPRWIKVEETVNPPHCAAMVPDDRAVRAACGAAFDPAGAILEFLSANRDHLTRGAASAAKPWPDLISIARVAIRCMLDRTGFTLCRGFEHEHPAEGESVQHTDFIGTIADGRWLAPFALAGYLAQLPDAAKNKVPSPMVTLDLEQALRLILVQRAMPAGLVGTTSSTPPVSHPKWSDLDGVLADLGQIDALMRDPAFLAEVVAVGIVPVVNDNQEPVRKETRDQIVEGLKLGAILDRARASWLAPYAWHVFGSSDDKELRTRTNDAAIRLLYTRLGVPGTSPLYPKFETYFEPAKELPWPLDADVLDFLTVFGSAPRGGKDNPEHDICLRTATRRVVQQALRPVLVTTPGPTPTPHPIVVSIAGRRAEYLRHKDGSNGGDPLRDIAGVGVLARRTSDPNWRCLNVARLDLRDETLTRSLPQLVVPLRAGMVDGLQQVAVSYDNASLVGVAESASTIGDDSEPSALGWVRYSAQRVNGDLSHGLLPRLRFGMKYEFAVFNIANGGMLPEELREDGSQNPALLRREFPKGQPGKPFPPRDTTVCRRYERLVPIGAPTIQYMELPTQPSSTREDKRVRPLAPELGSVECIRSDDPDPRQAPTARPSQGNNPSERFAGRVPVTFDASGGRVLIDPLDLPSETSVGYTMTLIVPDDSGVDKAVSCRLGRTHAGSGRFNWTLAENSESVADKDNTLWDLSGRAVVWLQYEYARSKISVSLNARDPNPTAAAPSSELAMFLRDSAGALVGVIGPDQPTVTIARKPVLHDTAPGADVRNLALYIDVDRPGASTARYAIPRVESGGVSRLAPSHAGDPTIVVLDLEGAKTKIATLRLAGPTTSVECWDRWATDTELASCVSGCTPDDLRAAVFAADRFFREQSEVPGSSRDPSVRDPAVGALLLELVPLFGVGDAACSACARRVVDLPPVSVPESLVCRGESERHAAELLDRMSGGAISCTIESGGSASDGASIDKHLNIRIPKGEIWELRVYPVLTQTVAAGEPTVQERIGACVWNQLRHLHAHRMDAFGVGHPVDVIVGTPRVFRLEAVPEASNLRLPSAEQLWAGLRPCLEGDTLDVRFQLPERVRDDLAHVADLRLIWQQYVWRGEKHDPRAHPFPAKTLTRFGDQSFATRLDPIAKVDADLAPPEKLTAFAMWETLAFGRHGETGRAKRTTYRFGDVDAHLYDRFLGGKSELKSAVMRFRLSVTSRYPWLTPRDESLGAGACAQNELREAWLNAGEDPTSEKPPTTTPRWKRLFVPCRVVSLDPPNPWLVIPLTGASPSEIASFEDAGKSRMRPHAAEQSRSCSDLLVLFREDALSHAGPGETIQPVVCETVYRCQKRDPPEQPKRDRILEVGTDPILTAKSPYAPTDDGANPMPGWEPSVKVVAGPIGHTHDVEDVALPKIVASSFVLRVEGTGSFLPEVPGLGDATSLSIFESLLMAKLQFMRTVNPAAIHPPRPRVARTRSSGPPTNSDTVSDPGVGPGAATTNPALVSERTPPVNVQFLPNYDAVPPMLRVHDPILTVENGVVDAKWSTEAKPQVLQTLAAAKAASCECWLLITRPGSASSELPDEEAPDAETFVACLRLPDDGGPPRPVKDIPSDSVDSGERLRVRVLVVQYASSDSARSGDDNSRDDLLKRTLPIGGFTNTPSDASDPDATARVIGMSRYSLCTVGGLGASRTHQRLGVRVRPAQGDRTVRV